MSNTVDQRPVRAILAVGNPARERELREALSAAGIEVVERCLDGPSLLERARAYDADVALASAELHRLSEAALVELRETRLPLVLLLDSRDFGRYAGLAHLVSNRCSATEAAAAVRQAMVRGAVYETVPSGDGASVGTGSESRDGNQGRLLVLVSGKGAPGVTTLAIGLADVLAERGRRVVLVDADLRGGNVVPYLDLDPTRGILGLGVGRHGANGDLPVGEELQDGPGFMVLAGVEQPEYERGPAAELATAAAAELRRTFDEVIVDGGQVVAGNTRAGEALLRASDTVLIVSGTDLVSAWNAQCCAQYLRELGVPPERLAVIINRREARAGYGAAEVEQALNLPVAAVLPEDRRAARRARSEQLPVTAGGGKVARRLRDLAASLTAETGAPARTSRPRRWFARPSRLAVGRK